MTSSLHELMPYRFSSLHVGVEMTMTGLQNQQINQTTPKGQLISKANCQAVNCSKKQMNEFVFTTMRTVFVCFLEEIEDTKKKPFEIT